MNTTEKENSKHSTNQNMTEDEEYPEILHGRSDALPDGLRGVMITAFQGPLPHPGTLRDYETIVPGSGERIIAMAEKEQNARHQDRRSGRAGGNIHFCI